MTAKNYQWPSVPGTRKREGAKNLPVATWNVRTMNADGKLNMLVEEMKRLHIKILGISETHWTEENEDAFIIDGYTVIASSRRDGVRRQGVALMIETETTESMTNYLQTSERLVGASFKMVEGSLDVLQVYAPDTSYSDDEYQRFLDEIQYWLDRVKRNSKIILMGDFNAKIGSEANEVWPEAVGKYGLGEKNGRGEMLMQFCAINELVISNSFFKHRPGRRATWISPDGQTRNQIDYIIVSKEVMKSTTNSRVYNSADVGSDHSLLMANINIATRKPKKSRPSPRRYDVERLLDQELRNDFVIKIGGAFEALQDLMEDQTVQVAYREFVDTTNKITEETVGYKKKRQVEGMSKELENKCNERRIARLRYLKQPANNESRENYRIINRSVKSEVSRQKRLTIEKKVEQLERDFISNNSHNLFKMVREMEGKPHRQPNTIKDRNGTIQCEQTEVMKCWQNHFTTQLNTEFPHSDAALDSIQLAEVENDNNPPSEREVEKSIKDLRNRKSPGFDKITAEVLKAGGKHMVKMLQYLFRKIWEDVDTPDDWSKLLINPIHKKGDKLNPENYRAISLTSVPCKVFCKVILSRIEGIIEESMGESQFGFRTGRGTTDAIFVARQIMEKAKEHNVPIHFNFIDFKAAFDTVWREALWKFMNSVGVSKRIIDIIKKMYHNTQCAVMIGGTMTEWFGVEVGVRQGCILSPTLFNLFLEFVMKELNSIDRELNYREKTCLDIRYADDTTLLSVIFEKLRLTTQELETACLKWGLKINSKKCKIMTEGDNTIRIEGEEVQNVGEFVFLGSMLPSTTMDVNRRIALASSAFGRLRRTVWTRRDISRKLKIRLYKSLILPIAIYAGETWTLKAEDARRLEVFEMRCLRAILGVTRRERLTNEYIRRELEMTETITDVVRKKRLRWFGHVLRRPPESYILRVYWQDFTAPRPRARPPKRWRDQIPEDVGLPLHRCEEMALDGEEWWRGAVRGRRRARGRYDLRP